MQRRRFATRRTTTLTSSPHGTEPEVLETDAAPPLNPGAQSAHQLEEESQADPDAALAPALTQLLTAPTGAAPGSLSPEDDAALVERARTDAAAFGVLYERYVDRIYSYVYHRVGNAQDAEDLTARTFHRALDHLDRYEDRGLPFAAWLFRIAHNLVANWHRDRSRRRFLSLDRIWSHRTEGDDPEGVLERKESHDALWAAIQALPPDRRDLLLYKFSGRMSNVEIGLLMHKSESAIKSLYFRTLASLRKELEARGWGPPANTPPPGGPDTDLADDE